IAPYTCSVLYGRFVMRIMIGGEVLFCSARSNEGGDPFAGNWMDPAFSERMMWLFSNRSIMAFMSRILNGLMAQVEMVTPFPSSQVLYPRAVAQRSQARIWHARS